MVYYNVISKGFQLESQARCLAREMKLMSNEYIIVKGSDKKLYVAKKVVL